MLSRLRFHLAARLLLLAAVLSFLSLGTLPGIHAQSPTPLPKTWNDAVAQIASQVAAALSPSASILLDVKNISSIDASYAGAIRLATESELRRHSFQLVSSTTGSAQPVIQLQLTLSESAGAYVWVAEISQQAPQEPSAPPIIVSVPKTAFSNDGSGSQSLSLQARFAWKQPERFLDFALMSDPASGMPRILVLMPNQIALYEFFDSQWKLSRTAFIPQNASRSRDPGGEINVKEGYASVAGLKCTGQPNLTGDVQCAASAPFRAPVHAIDISGVPHSLGTAIPGTCRDEMIWLYTGEGDWTEADSIQGYLAKGAALPMAPSGGAIHLDGPVLSLRPDPDTSSARAVIHNLKTGNFEAYTVTATCSR